MDVERIAIMLGNPKMYDGPLLAHTFSLGIKPDLVTRTDSVCVARRSVPCLELREGPTCHAQMLTYGTQTVILSPYLRN